MPPFSFKSFRILPTYSFTDNLFMASTFRDIVDEVGSPVKQHATLPLSCEVMKIKNNKNGSIYVEAPDGFSCIFDSVVITAPLDWLKRNEQVF